MFTGIIQRRGTVTAIETAEHGRVLRIDAGGWPPRRQPGESIAVNGCCLTAVDTADDELRFDVVPQTLSMTTLGDLAAGDAVNLERAVTPETLLGGHVVQGHIDGVGVVSAVHTGEEHRVRITAPEALLPHIVDKGSIAVDGVSLTVAGLTDDGFEVALVPTTLEVTTMGALAPARRVNLETDYLVKAVARCMQFERAANSEQRTGL